LQAQLGTAHLAHLAIFPTFTLLPGLGLSSISEPGVGFIPPTTLINQQQTTTTGFWTVGFLQAGTASNRATAARYSQRWFMLP